MDYGYARATVPVGPPPAARRQLVQADEVNWRGNRTPDPLARRVDHRGVEGVAYPTLYKDMRQGSPINTADRTVPWWHHTNRGTVKVDAQWAGQFKQTLVNPNKFFAPVCRCEKVCGSPEASSMGSYVADSEAAGSDAPAAKDNTAIKLDNDEMDLDAVDWDGEEDADRGMGADGDDDDAEEVWEEDDDDDDGGEEDANGGADNETPPEGAADDEVAPPPAQEEPLEGVDDNKDFSPAMATEAQKPPPIVGQNGVERVIVHPQHFEGAASGAQPELGIHAVVDMWGHLRVTMANADSPFSDVEPFSLLLCIEGEPVKPADALVNDLRHLRMQNQSFSVLIQGPDYANDPRQLPDQALPGEVLEVHVPLTSTGNREMGLLVANDALDRLLILDVNPPWHRPASPFRSIPVWSMIRGIKGVHSRDELVPGSQLSQQLKERMSGSCTEDLTVYIETPGFASRAEFERSVLMNKRSRVAGAVTPTKIMLVWPRDPTKVSFVEQPVDCHMPTQPQVLQAIWGMGNLLEDTESEAMRWATDLQELDSLGMQEFCLPPTKETVRTLLSWLTEGVSSMDSLLLVFIGEGDGNGGFRTHDETLYPQEILDHFDGCEAQVMILCDSPGFTCGLDYTAANAPRAPNCRLTVAGIDALTTTHDPATDVYTPGSLICTYDTALHHGKAADVLNMMATYLSPHRRLCVGSTAPLPVDVFEVQEPVRGGGNGSWQKTAIGPVDCDTHGLTQRLQALAGTVFGDEGRINEFMAQSVGSELQQYRTLMVRFAGGVEPENDMLVENAKILHEMLQQDPVDQVALESFVVEMECTQHAWEDLLFVYESLFSTNLRTRLRELHLASDISDLMLCRGVLFDGEWVLDSSAGQIKLQQPTRICFVWCAAEGEVGGVEDISHVLRALWSFRNVPEGAQRHLIHVPLRPDGLAGSTVLLKHPHFITPSKASVLESLDWLTQSTTADDSLLLVLLGSQDAAGGFRTTTHPITPKEILSKFEGVHPDAHVTVISDTSPTFTADLHYHAEQALPTPPCRTLIMGYDPDEAAAGTVGDLITPYAMAVAHHNCAVATDSSIKGFNKVLNLMCSALPQDVCVFLASTHQLVFPQARRRVVGPPGCRWNKAVLGPFRWDDAQPTEYLSEVAKLCYRHPEHASYRAGTLDEYAQQPSEGIRELVRRFTGGPYYREADVDDYVRAFARRLTPDEADILCEDMTTQEFWDDIAAKYQRTHNRSLHSEIVAHNETLPHIVDAFLARGLYFEQGSYAPEARPVQRAASAATAKTAEPTPKSTPAEASLPPVSHPSQPISHATSIRSTRTDGMRAVDKMSSHMPTPRERPSNPPSAAPSVQASLGQPQSVRSRMSAQAPPSGASSVRSEIPPASSVRPPASEHEVRTMPSVQAPLSVHNPPSVRPMPSEPVQHASMRSVRDHPSVVQAPSGMISTSSIPPRRTLEPTRREETPRRDFGTQMSEAASEGSVCGNEIPVRAQHSFAQQMPSRHPSAVQPRSVVQHPSVAQQTSMGRPPSSAKQPSVMSQPSVVPQPSATPTGFQSTSDAQEAPHHVDPHHVDPQAAEREAEGVSVARDDVPVPTFTQQQGWNSRRMSPPRRPVSGSLARNRAAPQPGNIDSLLVTTMPAPFNKFAQVFTLDAPSARRQGSPSMPPPPTEMLPTPPTHGVLHQAQSHDMQNGRIASESPRPDSVRGYKLPPAQDAMYPTPSYGSPTHANAAAFASPARADGGRFPSPLPREASMGPGAALLASNSIINLARYTELPQTRSRMSPLP